MPTLPLSPRKAISSIRPPHIASVRGLKISPPETRPFPEGQPVSIPQISAFFASPLELGDGILFQFEPGIISPPSIVTLPIGMPPFNPPQQTLDALKTPLFEGASYIREDDEEILGPMELPRAYTPVYQKDGWKAVDVDPLRLLHPLLEPKVSDADSRGQLLPRPLREDQEEALDTLLAKDHLYFADDRGSGKRFVVAAALRALVQEGKATHILILSSEEGLRSWAFALHRWAGSLSVTLVRGDQEQRLLDWRTPVFVYLARYPTFSQDLQHLLKEENIGFDTLVLDNVLVESRRGGLKASVINQIPAARRWALAGALPQRREEWLNVFGILDPGSVKGGSQITLPDLKQQFLSITLRRSREEFKGLASRVREILWLDMDSVQTQAYQESLAEERHRLRKLGGTLTRTHVDAALQRLKRVGSFIGDSIDSVKVHALVDLVEDISAAGEKVVVFSQFPEHTFDRLQTVLEAYGLLQIRTGMTGDEGAQCMAQFREDASIHVLLADTQARSDGQMLPQASYIIHYDYEWNPASRLRAEHRFFPNLHRDIPLHIYELAVVRTVDESIQKLLGNKRMLPGQLARGTRPAELEEKITLDEWLEDIFSISSSIRETQEAVSHAPGSGPLPSTGYLRSRFEEQSPQEFMQAIGEILEALGFPAWQMLGEPDEKGGDILASRAEVGEVDCVLVRCIRTRKKVGISDARKVVRDAQKRPGCIGAQLITTTDFTSACTKFADEADHQLGLMSGSELFRHLRILGKAI